MLRQSIGPRREVSGKPVLLSGSLQNYISGGRRILDKPGLTYSYLVGKVKEASPAHIPSTRLTLHAFVDGFVHLVGPRFFSHLFIIVMAAVIATVSGITTSKMSRAASLNPWQFDPFTVRSLTDSKDYIGKPSLPFTTKPKRPREGLTTYEVKPGDTVSTLAERFEISADSIVSANKLEDADSLTAGDKLVILPISGILHVVVEGDSLESVAAKYEVEALTIVQSDYNNLAEPYIIFVDQKIIVPGGTMPEVKKIVPVAKTADRPVETASASVQPAPPPVSSPRPVSSPPLVSSPPPAAPSAAVRSSSRFTWPTTGQITQGYSSYHPAIDLGPPYGSPIYASEAGVVVSVEHLSYGYGWNLMIDHGDGFQSRYAHVSKFIVGQGQAVARGQLIALIGNTGLATGPHLHFEIYQNGVRVNPLRYLP
ncbi:MAG: M23 family metallopeptidase [Dehalococcoidia bacterium]|nr:M23 family metallopeptidase [Dehalococcoidia bacterium]